MICTDAYGTTVDCASPEAMFYDGLHPLQPAAATSAQSGALNVMFHSPLFWSMWLMLTVLSGFIAHRNGRNVPVALLVGAAIGVFGAVVYAVLGKPKVTAAPPAAPPDVPVREAYAG